MPLKTSYPLVIELRSQIEFYASTLFQFPKDKLRKQNTTLLTMEYVGDKKTYVALSTELVKCFCSVCECVPDRERERKNAETMPKAAHHKVLQGYFPSFCAKVNSFSHVCKISQ